MTSNQKHTGSGNNIGRDLVNNYHSIGVNDLISIVHEWMYDIVTHRFEVVLVKIDTYRKLPLSREVENLFTILTNFVNSFKNSIPIDTSLLKTELNNHKDSKFNDLYRALLVRSLATEDIGKAKEVYKSFNDKAENYLLASFDQHFASRESLQTRFNNKLFLLDDYSLFYLAQGFWRIYDYTSAEKVFNTISAKGNHETIQYWIIASQLNNITYSKDIQLHYPSKAITKKIETISNDFVKLTSSKVNLSSLATSILIAFVNLTKSSIYLPEIRKIALDYRQDIGKINTNLEQTLNQISGDESFKAPMWLITKLESNQPLNRDGLDLLITSVLHESIEFKIVENWLTESSISLDSDIFYIEFLKMFLLSFKSFNNVTDKDNYLIILKVFLQDYISQLTNISAVIIRHWCDNLNRLNTQFEVIVFNILEAVCHNLAVNSDLNYYYLQSLMHLDRLKSMRQELDRIDNDEWSRDLYLFQARYYLKINNYLKAKDNYLKFISEEKNLYIWHEFLVSCMGIDVDFSLARIELYQIPKSILNPKHDGFEFFINQLQFIDFNFSEAVIIGLFIENPIDNAPIVVKFYFNSFSNNTDISCDKNKNFKDIHLGIVYKTKNQSKIALIVDNELAKHKELIGIDSELGQILAKSSIGKKIQYNFNTVTIIEYQSVRALLHNLK